MWSIKFFFRYCIDCLYLKLPFSFYRRIASLMFIFFCTASAVYYYFYFAVSYPSASQLILSPAAKFGNYSLNLLEPYKLMNTYNKSLINQRQQQSDLSHQLFRKILFWDEAYGGYYDIGGGRDVFHKAGCPVWQCSSTDDRQAFKHKEFDAIVFHQRSWYTYLSLSIV